MKPRWISALALAALFAANLAPESVAEEERRVPVAKAAIFLPFDFYGRHREALGLTEEQVRAMEHLAEGMREPARKLESERARQTKALLETMGQTPVDPDAAMARLQAVLAAENELKALQFRNGIAMRNTLSAEQLRKLDELVARDGARVSGAPTELGERIQLLRAEIHQRSGGQPTAEVLAQLKQIEKTAREGRHGEAKAQLEQLLRQLRQEPSSAAKPAAAESPR